MIWTEKLESFKGIVFVDGAVRGNQDTFYCFSNEGTIFIKFSCISL